MKDSSHYSSIEGFFNRMIPDKKLELTQKWNYIQKTFSREDVLVIEFEADSFEESYWKCNFGRPNTTLDIFLEPRTRMNNALVSSFSGEKVDNPTRLFNNTKSNEKWIGFFMPSDLLKLNKLPEVEESISRLKIFKEHFDFDSFLKQLFKDNEDIETNDERVFLSLIHI